MTLTIELTTQEEAWLNAEAAQQGVPPAEIIHKILGEHQQTPSAILTPAIAFPPTGRAVAYLRECLVTEASDDPEELRKEEEDIAEMKRNMNEERRRSGAEPIF